MGRNFYSQSKCACGASIIGNKKRRCYDCEDRHDQMRKSLYRKGRREAVQAGSFTKLSDAVAKVMEKIGDGRGRT